MFGTLIKIVLFFISTLGTFELLRNLSREGINRYFLPSLTIAVQITILFLAGLLNILKETTLILYLVGFYGILKSFYQRKNLQFLKYYFKIGYVFLFLVMMITALYVRGKIFVGFDNFSHWALVVRRMLEVNRYPNFEDTLIAFQEYPLGSATYIYYFAKLTSRSESFQMLAQAYMIAASVLPLFAFAKRNRLVAAIVMFFFVNFLFVYNIPIVDLLVDTLLPLIGICGLVFTYQNCREKELKLNLLFSSCYMVQILQTKNSGIFFVILIVIVLMLFAKKNKLYLQNIAASAVPFLSLLLWQKHCQYVFPSAALSKHAMTIENYKTVFGDKTPEDIMTICSSFIKFSLTYKDIYVTAAIGLLIGCLIYFFDKKLWKFFVRIALFTLGLYMVYQAGTLAMYIFSMPKDEALLLMAVKRYTKTVLIAICYLYMVPAITMLADLNENKKQMVIASGTLAICFMGFMYIDKGIIHFMSQDVADASERKWIEQTGADYNIPLYESYCILIPEGDYGYSKYLLKYIFQSNDVSYVVVDNIEDLDSIGAKYIFIYDQENEIIKDWILEKYPEQSGQDVITQPEI